MDDQDKAKWTCFVCPVKQECEEYFQRSKSKHGIWAGENKDL